MIKKLESKYKTYPCLKFIYCKNRPALNKQNYLLTFALYSQTKRSMYKKTKIVATISDKRCDVDFLRSLFENGMNVVRLNTAHQNHEQALKVINNVRKVSEKIAILLDTKGPEIRTNAMDEDLAVKRGDIIKMKGKPNAKSDDGFIYLSYKGFVTDVKIGSKILIDDGVLELKVNSKKSDYLLCEVQNDGRYKVERV